MFEKVLITNRGDQSRSGAAAQPNRAVAAGHEGGLATEIFHV
jgi:hypothetical protein